MWWWIGLKYASIHFNSRSFYMNQGSRSIYYFIPIKWIKLILQDANISSFNHHDFFVVKSDAPALKHHRITWIRSLQGHPACNSWKPPLQMAVVQWENHLDSRWISRIRYVMHSVSNSICFWIKSESIKNPKFHNLTMCWKLAQSPKTENVRDILYILASYPKVPWDMWLIVLYVYVYINNIYIYIVRIYIYIYICV